MIVTCAAVLAVIFHRLNAFEIISGFLQAHEDWQLDELFFVLVFGGIAALVIAIRRAGDLGREMRRREDAEARAISLARHDPLTGLPNRRVLQEELPTLIAEGRELGVETAVLMIDLDNFKPVNDVLGHEAGDALLIDVSRRLELACEADTLIARVGGDEFVVVMPRAPDAEAASRMASKLIREISAPYSSDARSVEIGATIGIARAPANSVCAEQLLRAADIAMYEAKRSGKGSHRFFHAEMDARLRDRAELESDLRGAMGRGEILAYFQPVMSLAENRILGFEALARWIHPTRGLIQPDTFIPIAEDNGLIDELSQLILREGCIAARDWHPDTTLSINISPLQLRDPWLAARMLSILTETGIAPQRLIVEVTENAIIDDIDLAAEVFASLQRAGIRIALDDFGKGYSSLSHLRQLKFNHLKIDSSFVRSMDSVESQKIVSAVAGLGKALGMPVTAEGVETLEVAAALRLLGCERAQGFLFGAPAGRIAAAHLIDDEDARVLSPKIRALK